MEWLGWILFVILLILYLSYGKYSAKGRTLMLEYVEFLFFQPDVYRDHRAKFIAFLKEQTERDRTRLAVISYEALDKMAQALPGGIFLANVVIRSDPSKASEPN